MSPNDSLFAEELIGGWAGRTHSPHLVARPTDVASLHRAVEAAWTRSRSVIAKGAGCSYADQIQNRSGAVIDCTGLSGILSWDASTGRMTVLAGTTLADILRIALPAGWTIPGVPGSFMVTVGGAIANDVHGKDAHRWSFGAAVQGFDLLDAGGSIRTVTPQRDGELFWAVIGGLGLLGIVVSAKLQLAPVTSAWLEVETLRTASLRESLEHFRERDGMDFALGWMDGLAHAGARGRGVISFAKWASRADSVPKAKMDRALTVNDRMFGLLPSRLVWRAGAPMLRPPGLRATNAIYHALAVGQLTRIVPFPEFYFLYNRINGLDEAYRPHGFAEIQALLPSGRELEVCNAMLDVLHDRHVLPIFMTMKGHVADRCLLGFPGQGLSVTFGLRKPAGDRTAFRSVLAELFELVISAEGRVNPSKDEFLSSSQFRRMYAGADAFLELKRRLDPEGRFQSEQYRRLFGAA